MEIYKDNGSGMKCLKIKSSGKSLEIPGCILYSRGGMVPHLTDENISLVNNIPDKFCNLPLSSIYEQPGPDVMLKFSGSFHEFSSSQDTVWILNTNDSYLPKQDVYKYNEEKCISIWAPSGRRKITPEEYMNIIEVFALDIAIAPSDTIPSGLSKKRCRKSTERTLRFLDSCLQIKEEKKMTVPVLGVVEGGDSLVFREKSAKELATRDVDAYVIGGLDRIISTWKELLEVSTKHLKANKAKIMFGVMTPREVLQAIELGVDMFDTVIAYDATERGCALNFPFISSLQNSNSNSVEEKESKRAKTEEDDTLGPKDLSIFELDLNNRRYFDDDQPLVQDCHCYTCVHHVRAYIHHLLVTKEMLASVLLMMHNLTYWLDFFKEVRKSIKENRFYEIKEIIEKGNTGNE